MSERTVEAARQFVDSIRRDVLSDDDGVTSVSLEVDGMAPVVITREDGWGVDSSTGEVTGDERWPVPAESRFDDQEVDFLPAPDLDAVATEVISRWPELRWLEAYTVELLWKRRGGSSGDRATLGKCVRPSGLTRHFARTTWVIWLAADHARDLNLTRHQVEALIYHELCHCAVKGEEMEPGTVGHDLEMFTGEVRRYGLWKHDLEIAARAMQAALPGFGGTL